MADTPLKHAQAQDGVQKKPKPDTLQRTPDIQEMPDVDTMALRKAIDQPGPLSPDNAKKVQRTYGNQFVQRLAKGTIVSGSRGDGAPAKRVEKKVSRSSGGDNGGTASPIVENKIERSRGSGEALPDETRQSMESGFGADFSSVTVHNNSESHALSRSLNARAFTTGSDVYFGKGEYSPGTSDGDELIGHELTHVVQQGSAPMAPQTKLEVNEPGDEYEQEADSMAKEVTSSQNNDAVQTQEDDLPDVMGMPLMRSMAASGVVPGLNGAIQRDEDEEKSEEDKEKEEQEKQEMGEEGRKEGEGNANAPEKKGEEEAAPEAETKGDEGTEDVEILAEPTPVDAPAEEDLEAEFEEPEIEEQASMTEESTEEVLDTFSWENTKPPAWDNQEASQELFSALFAEDGGEMTELLSGGGEAEGVTQGDSALPAVRSTESDTKETAKFEPSQPDTISYAPFTKPTAGSGAGAYIADALVVDAIGGTAVDIGNVGASIGKETNAFGVMAGVLDLIIKITELITNILGLISLILAIVAAILYGLGTAFAAAVFTAPAAPPLLSIASTLMVWVNNLGIVTLYITVARMHLRALSMALRGLSILYMWANGATAEEIQAQVARVTGHAIGMVIDGISVAMAVAPGTGAGSIDDAFAPAFKTTGKQFAKSATKEGAKAAAKEAAKGATKEFGKELAQAGVGAVVGAGVGMAGNEANKAAGGGIESAKAEREAEEKKKWEEENPVQKMQMDSIQREDDEMNAELDDESEEVFVELPPIPNSPERVDAAAGNIATIHVEREMTMTKIAYIDDMLRIKQGYSHLMGAMNERAAMNQVHMDTANAASSKQISTAQEYAGKADEAGKKAAESEKSGDKAAGGVEGQQGNIESGSEKAAEEGKSDPAMSKGGDVANDATQGPQASGETVGISGQEAGAARQMASKSEGLLSDTMGAQDTTADFQDTVLDKDSENQDEMDDLSSTKEELLARLDELEGEEEEQMAEHEDARTEADEWVGESQAIEENKALAMGSDEGSEEYDAEAENLTEELAGADEDE